jgi:hypothetical protein
MPLLPDVKENPREFTQDLFAYEDFSCEYPLTGKVCLSLSR